MICECKSLKSINRVLKSKALKLIQLLDKKLQDSLDRNYRIEVSFKNLPTHWNRNFAEQLSGGIRTLLKLKYVERGIELSIENKHKTWIKLSKISDPMFFRSTINVANKLKNNNPTLVLSEVPNLKKNIKDTIKDARTQIPKESNSLIFLNSLNEHYAKQAIEEFFKDNNPTNLLAVLSGNKNVNIHRNLNCKVNILNYLTRKRN